MSKFYLHFINPSIPKTSFSEDKITIGKSKECELELPYSGISKKHAIIFNDKNSFFIKDLFSTTGTLLNGKEIGDRVVKLSPNDLIVIGSVEMRFTFSEEEEFLDDTNSKEFLQLIPISSPSIIMQKILIYLKKKFSAENTLIFIKSQYSEELFPYMSTNGEISPHILPTLRVSKTLIYKSFSENKSIVITNAQLHQEFSHAKSVIAHNISSVLSLPLNFNNEELGLLYISSSSFRFKKSDRLSIKSLVSLLSLLLYCILGKSKVEKLELDKEDDEHFSTLEELLEKPADDFEKAINWLTPLNKATDIKSNDLIGEILVPEKIDFRKFIHPELNYDFSKGKIISRTNGTIIRTDSRLFFHKLYQLKCNVDIKVGNISYSGAVIIDGDVTDNYNIKSQYDMTIKGKVGKSDLESVNGKVTVTNYVVGGKKNRIIALKDIDILAGYSTYLKSLRNIIIHKNMVGTILNAGKKAIIEVNDKFRDNIITAGQQIILKCNIPVNSIGYIELKINSREALAEIFREKNNSQMELTKINSILDKNSKIINKLFLNAQKLSSIDFANKNLIKNELKKYENLKVKSDFLTEKIYFLNSLIKDYKKFVPEIIVMGNLPSGTTFFINGICEELTEKVHNVRIYEENRKIIIKSL